MKEDPYIVCLVPTRGDRPKMLKRCIEMLSRQTLQPKEVILMNDPPLDPYIKDITWRYRIGFQRAIERHPDLDLILIIEDDDWYSRAYIEIFYNAWVQAGRPDIFGVGETYYYHLGLRKFYHQKHEERASAFSTGVTKAISKMKWPKDDYSFVDMEMWKQLEGKTFTSSPLISLGIKGHMEGRLFGGIGHNERWNGYNNSDPNLTWIRSFLDDESIDFYFQDAPKPVGPSDSLGPLTVKG
jgi:cellulose synthase/poly-beta-1,6-N-acetylglucosamine synthase-like glycosyltransferase